MCRKRRNTGNDITIYPYSSIFLKYLGNRQLFGLWTKRVTVLMLNPVIKGKSTLIELKLMLPKIYLLERGFLNLYAHVGRQKSHWEQAWLRK